MYLSNNGDKQGQNWKTNIYKTNSNECYYNTAVFKWLSKNQNQNNNSDQSKAGADSPMNQSQFLAITCNSLVARVKLRVHGAVGFGFDSH